MIDIDQSAIVVLALHIRAANAELTGENRIGLGKFTSPEELSLYADLAPDRVDAFRDLLLFG